MHGGMPAVPPPPYPNHQNGFRAASRGGHGNSGSHPSVPPPPPYPPPHQPLGYYYGMMHQSASMFEYQAGFAPMARMYGYGYGPPAPPPPGVPLVGSQPVLYPSSQVPPTSSQGTVSRTRPPRAGPPVSAPKPHSHDHTPRRSPRLQGANVRRETGRAPPVGPSPEHHAGSEVMNAMGLPVRPGKPDCKHFLSRGWCSYGQSCRYNHPEVVRPRLPADLPSRPVAQSHGHGVMGMAPSPWAGVGMPYPVYGWPNPQMAMGGDPGAYGPSWGYHPSSVMYYPSAAPPPLRRVDKSPSQPANCSARSSDSAASSSSRMLDPASDNLSEPKDP